MGLLYDLFSGAVPSQGPRLHGRGEISTDEAQAPLPWKLIVHFTDWPTDQLVKLDAEGKVLHDAFINSVKEADFLRNGTAKGIMSLSKNDSTQLWKAVEERMYLVPILLVLVLIAGKMTLIHSTQYVKSCSTHRVLLYGIYQSGYIFHLHHQLQSLLRAISKSYNLWLPQRLQIAENHRRLVRFCIVCYPHCFQAGGRQYWQSQYYMVLLCLCQQ